MDGKVLSDFVFAGATSDAPVVANGDDDLDFLANDSAATNPVWDRAAPGQPRRAEADRLARVLGGDLKGSVDLWRAAAADSRLSRVDGDGLWVLCAAALGAADSASAGADLAAGGLATLAARALAAGDPDLAWAGVRLTLHGAVVALQSPLAEALDRHLLAWNRDQRAAVLDFLDAHGDGRCVRPLEALLVRHGAALDDAQAYKARHIVQAIRRARRK